MDNFLEKYTKISLKLGISAFEEGGQDNARAKTIKYRYKHFTSSRLRIWHRFQKSQIKSYKFGLLLKYWTPCILMDCIVIRSIRRVNVQLVIREIDTSIGHKSENVLVTWAFNQWNDIYCFWVGNQSVSANKPNNSIILTTIGWFNIPICSPWNYLSITLYTIYSRNVTLPKD